MSQLPESVPHDPVTPSRRDRLRPLELLGFSGVLAVFAGLIVLMVTKGDWILTAFAAGIAFIACVVVVALLGLGGKPSKEDDEARKDLQQPENGKNWH
ncbi:ABC transporter ATP-binding protein [Leucobacter insecticola]|uniref:ABC transporter ATP-binding protein n=1 Tax=Leucobacter insecticola TaxID=2714934 RepID=A0A6G8FGS2_9MICO|nr:ABC transporter ATP-binding protein [Leucobacter insecticola]QIM15581.1 ABC transporter ATP-binding protein [Leucobacter insecticola]